MTPLIDVLLVLLIIFMAISPTQSMGLDAKVPRPAPDSSSPQSENDVILSIDADHTIRLNSRSLSRAELPAILRSALAPLTSRVIFLRAAPELEYRDVAEVLDTAREAGARIGLMAWRP